MSSSAGVLTLHFSTFLVACFQIVVDVHDSGDHATNAGNATGPLRQNYGSIGDSSTNLVEVVEPEVEIAPAQEAPVYARYPPASQMKISHLVSSSVELTISIPLP